MPIIIRNIKRILSLEILSIKSTSLSLTRLWGKVVYNVEKSYVDRLDARRPRDFNLLTKKEVYRTFHRLFHSI